MALSWQDVCRRRWSASRLIRALDYVIPPVNMYDVATRLGAKVFVLPSDARVSGMLVLDDGVPNIYYRDGEAPVRQRFTIAHELAHLILHAGPRYLLSRERHVEFRDTDGYLTDRSKPEEAQANGYAARLLMPDHMLNAVLLAGIAPREIANVFAVSEEAARNRLRKYMGV